MIFFVRACVNFLWRGRIILFFGGEVAQFFLLRVCVILCVKRLCDFCFVCLWRLGDFLCVERLLDFFVHRLRAFLVKRLNTFFVDRLRDF